MNSVPLKTLRLANAARISLSTLAQPGVNTAFFSRQTPI